MKLALQSFSCLYLSGSTSSDSLSSLESCSAPLQCEIPSLIFSPPSPRLDSDSDSDGLLTPVDMDDEMDGSLAPPSTPSIPKPAKQDAMDLDERDELQDGFSSAAFRRPLQRTFSFPTLCISGTAPTDNLPSSPIKQGFGWCPTSFLRTLSDDDPRPYDVLCVLLEQYYESESE